MPPAANTLALDVAGVPVPDVRLTLFDATGAEVPMRTSPVPGGIQRYETVVDPGGYSLLVAASATDIRSTVEVTVPPGPA